MSISLQDDVVVKLDKYYKLLIEWNKKMNLTAITEKDEVYKKHFEDSLQLSNYVTEEEMKDKRVIDIGTGAGLPGIPLAIRYPETEFLLLDSLDKRIRFLQCVIESLNLKNVTVLHGRAEDAGKKDEYRGQFDYCVSRAVAELPILLEYCVPFVKVNGFFIPYKSMKTESEIDKASHAFEELDCHVKKVEHFCLDGTEERTLIFIKKLKETKLKYPRRAGLPNKKPL